MNDVRLRDTRRANWFWVQNVLIDVFQPVIGPLGVTVYNALCRLVRNDAVDVTMRELGESATVSKDTAQRMLAKMQALNMIGMKPAGRGRKVYVLHDLEDAAGSGSAEDQIAGLRRKLAAAELAGKVKPSTRSRQEVALEEPSLFDVPDTHADEIADFENNHGQGPKPDDAVSLGDKVRVRDLGEMRSIHANEAVPASLPETGCLKTGGDLSQKEGVLSQNSDPYLMLVEDKNKIEDKPRPVVPPVGRDGSSSRPGIAEFTPDGSNLEAVLSGISALKPVQGDVSDLREQIAAHMRRAGFEVTLGARIADRGDGRPGMIDIWCQRGFATVGIECDAATPRDRSLMKLRRLDDKTRRVLVLRTGAAGGAWADSNILVIGMGWPGNMRESGPERSVTLQQARAEVGAGAVSPVATGPADISAASVREVFATLRSKVKATAESMGFDYCTGEIAGLKNPLWEWDEAFGTAETVSIHGQSVALSTHNRAATLEGLRMYSERIAREMIARFGCPVLVELVEADSGSDLASSSSG